MSTRCQVKVSETVNNKEIDAVTLYHYYDGYPASMLPLMAKAYTNARKHLEEKAKKSSSHPDYWQLGRAGHMASYLCREEPDGFEPEAGHKLHGDIEWYYELKPSQDDKSMAADLKWIVTVYVINGFDKGQKKIPVVEGELTEAAKMAAAIENEGNKISEGYYKTREKKIKA